MTYCTYAYSLGALGIFWTLMLAFFQCLAMECFGLGRVLELFFELLALAWWIVGGSLLIAPVTDSNNAGLPNTDWRNAVLAMCWVSAFFFLIISLSSAYMIASGSAFDQ